MLNLLTHEPRGEKGWAGADSWAKTPAAAIAVSAMHCGVETLLSGGAEHLTPHTHTHTSLFSSAWCSGCGTTARERVTSVGCSRETQCRIW